MTAAHGLVYKPVSGCHALSMGPTRRKDVVTVSDTDSTTATADAAEEEAVDKTTVFKALAKLEGNYVEIEHSGAGSSPATGKVAILNEGCVVLATKQDDGRIGSRGIFLEQITAIPKKIKKADVVEDTAA